MFITLDLSQVPVGVPPSDDPRHAILSMGLSYYADGLHGGVPA